VDRCRRALFAAATCLGVAACDSTEPLPPAVFVQPATLTLEDGQSMKLTASLRNPKQPTVRWSSSNPLIATVDPTGVVSAVANGAATITAKMVDDTTVSASVPVTVSGPAIASMVLFPSSTTVWVGLTRQLGVQLRAADGRIIRGRRITWTSPDAAIAEVSTSGVVRGRGPGGPIAMTASSEGQTATALIRVAHDAEACPLVAALGIGQPSSGRLALGDCEFRADESYVDIYEFVLAESGTVQIDMVSADLDSYLGLFEATGRFLTQDDNTGGATNARIVTDLAAGRYRVWANTTQGAVSGAYTLTVTRR
jgi:hypothetical protein